MCLSDKWVSLYISFQRTRGSWEIQIDPILQLAACHISRLKPYPHLPLPIGNNVSALSHFTREGCAFLLPKLKGFFVVLQLVLGKKTISMLWVFITLYLGTLKSKDCFTIILCSLVSCPKVYTLVISSWIGKTVCGGVLILFCFVFKRNPSKFHTFFSSEHRTY